MDRDLDYQDWAAAEAEDEAALEAQWQEAERQSEADLLRADSPEATP
jgi:hypothetical protein